MKSQKMSDMNYFKKEEYQQINIPFCQSKIVCFKIVEVNK